MKRGQLEVGKTYLCALSGFKYLILEKRMDMEGLYIKAKYFNKITGEYFIIFFEDQISDHQLLEIKDEAWHYFHDCPS